MDSTRQTGTNLIADVLDERRGRLVADPKTEKVVAQVLDDVLPNTADQLEVIRTSLPPTLTVPEASRALRRSRAWGYIAAHDGRLPTRRTVAGLRVLREDLLRLILEAPLVVDPGCPAETPKDAA